jgi:DNA-binding response OmpR family regulator
MIKIPMRILVVDDEADFTDILALRLTDTGETAFKAYSGSEGLKKLETERIDVVILDIKMPGMDGIETLREIKKRFPLVEVLLLTGHGTTETAVEGMRLGAFDYLLKPSDFNELKAKLVVAQKRKDEQEERIRKAETKLILRKIGNY